MNHFEGRHVLPAVRSLKDFEELMEGSHPVVVLWRRISPRCRASCGWRTSTGKR